MPEVVSSESVGKDSGAADRQRLTLWFAGLVVVTWALATWVSLRPADVVQDWNGWRQADTQTIALNLVRGGSLFRPQISWGGDGPGFVEAEFQLYAGLVALLMRAFHPGEWAGQLVSLLAMAGAAFYTWRGAAENHGPIAAGLGLLAFFGSRSVPYLATVIQPDALALFGYAAAWTYWNQYIRKDSRRALALFTAFGAMAILVKPTEAQLGVSSFVLLLLVAPRRLRRAGPWLSWGVMLLVLGLHLAYAHHLYTVYGNTFGVLAGGDSKLPKLRQLVSLGTYLGVGKNVLLWGVGYGGALGAVVLAVGRRLNANHWAMIAGNAVLAIVALRYTSRSAGEYYFAPAAVLGAYLVAGAVQFVLQGWVGATATRRAIGLGFACLLLVVPIVRADRIRYYDQFPNPVIASVASVGRELGRRCEPGDLVVVRSPDLARDPVWNTPNNFEDPRIFYLSGTRGWVLGQDESDPSALERAAHRGAKFFADPLPIGSPRLDGWLLAHGTLLDVPGLTGRIWQLAVLEEGRGRGYERPSE